MCGIIAAIAERNVTPILVEGLKRLEYRGYDSAGLAVENETGIQRVRVVGKVANLEAVLEAKSVAGKIGIAHTRWATHGKPTENNAHPHMSANKLAIVHNGIIENFTELRDALKQQGIQCETETDTEVVAHLLQQHMGHTKPINAIRNVVKRLRGAYALVIVSQDHPEKLFVVCSGSPIVIGLGIGENFVSSDALSLLPVTNRFMYLQEGDIAEISRDVIKVVNSQGQAVKRDVDEIEQTADAATKGEYRHFMLKEIFEQPQAVANTLENAFNTKGEVDATIFGQEAATILKDVEYIKIVACGTSYHAGLVAKHFLESWVNMPCDVEIASEFRYRNVMVPTDTLLLTLSQSGETADTLAALREAKKRHFAATMCICNVANSSLVRESDLVFLTQAGPEIGVASTKAFTTQLTALYLLTILLGQLRHADAKVLAELRDAIRQLPGVLSNVLKIDNEIQLIAERFIDKTSCLFLGRGRDYPIALEGALKLKEISYIHAEGYAAGELKHGPIALVDNNLPVVVIAPEDSLFDKLKSNIQEVSARGGELYVVSETKRDIAADHQIHLPKTSAYTTPVIHVVPLQLLAYHIAVLKGTDVDQPRNLAKSVTVE